MFAGVGRLTDAVISNGGVAIKLGLDHGHDFRLARDRALAVRLFDRLRPQHAWFAWPCTPFCAWMKLAVLRNCDVAPRLREGRVHLRFSLGLARTQLLAGRQAHCENPLYLYGMARTRSHAGVYQTRLAVDSIGSVHHGPCGPPRRSSP